MALVVLRWRLNIRFLLRARDRAFGLVLMLPSYLALSCAGSVTVFFGLRALGARRPEMVLPLVSAVATGIGLAWAMAPLLAGVAFVETHDIGRLLAFPIPVRVLVLSSFVANLGQPIVLAALPLVLCFALAIGEGPLSFLGALVGGLLSFALILGGSELSALLLHRIARDRRLQDVTLFLGLGLGFVLSLLPLLIMTAGGRPVMGLVYALLSSDSLAVSPFAWGVRAGVHAGRGEVSLFCLWGGLALVAFAGCLALSGLIVHAIERGDLDVGRGSGARDRRGARMLLPGPLGALLEKDLRLSWREPALRAALVGSLLGPLFFLIVLTRSGSEGSAGHLTLALGSFVGMSTFGANAFGFERRGVALLLGFPVPRWRILLGKNVAAMIFRLPGILSLLIAGTLVAPPSYLPASLTIAFVTFLVCMGIDNYISVLFPTPAPAPGANPYGGAAAGARGLGTVFLSTALLAGSLLVSSPFVLLAWLPALLGNEWLWAATLPLAVLGAFAVYVLLLGGASRLLSRREPEMLERILWEA
jgi:ABC-2 type transport system permease protein